jgi:protein-L-isoaspartate(D-aspartate) O-methyltransferase
MAEAIRSPTRDAVAVERIRSGAELFDDLESFDLDPLIERIGDARVVALGEATHGTSEFYRLRARITRELIERHGFTIVAVEADWPDAARVDDYVRHAPRRTTGRPEWEAFARFPTWMWRNLEVHHFVEWLRSHNARLPHERRAGFYGLDLYSLHTSILAVLRYLQDVDPEAARRARERYACLSPWTEEPAEYGAAVLSGRRDDCEEEVVAMLGDLLARRMDYMSRDGVRFYDAVQNARLVANAEQYYRVMYRGSRESWNLRDRHMFETLRLLLAQAGPGARAAVWAHNSHVGNAAATRMGELGEINIGELCREAWELDAYLIGFGTDHGTVAAASEWDGPLEIKRVRPARPESYEGLCHRSGIASFVLPLRGSEAPGLVESLTEPRLERAIGVIYRPETELQSHYFEASLPRQFDAWIWLDETSAVTPLEAAQIETGDLPETYPFGL